MQKQDLNVDPKTQNLINLTLTSTDSKTKLYENITTPFQFTLTLTFAIRWRYCPTCRNKRTPENDNRIFKKINKFYDKIELEQNTNNKSTIDTHNNKWKTNTKRENL